MKNQNSGDTQKLATAKLGVSVSSGYRTEKGFRRPKKPKTHRTKIDPLADIWKSNLLPLLEAEPTLSGLKLSEYLDDKYLGKYPYSLLRTMQRRVKTYKLEHNK